MTQARSISAPEEPPWRRALRCQNRDADGLAGFLDASLSADTELDHVYLRGCEQGAVGILSGNKLCLAVPGLGENQSHSGSTIVVQSLVGDCWIEQDLRVASLAAGTYGLLDASRPMRMEAGEAFELLFIFADMHSLGLESDELKLLTAIPFGLGMALGGAAAGHLRILAKCFSSLTDTMFGRLFSAAMSMLSIAAMESPREKSRCSWSRLAALRRVKAFAAGRLSAPKLSPKMVSSELGISIRYLHALFSDESTTFSAWLWEQRLMACRARLTEQTDDTIGAIALEMGFTNFSHFSRRFREAFGVSAREFRRSSQPGNRR
jgi:AraC-like DNA-binding protein